MISLLTNFGMTDSNLQRSSATITKAEYIGIVNM